MTLVPGSRFGSYEIIAPLGAGGMGEVYRARDARLGRDVAIKIIGVDAAADPDRVRRFQQEARAAGQLSHPNVLVVHDIGIESGTPYLVSELLEGETLGTRLMRGRLSAREAIDIAIQIARGLQAAHERGIVHRDLKPDNVFITTDDRVKILDFGLAKLTMPPAGAADETATALLTEPGRLLGTVAYMAPEQVRGEDVDARADIFAFGAVLHEMLAGERAFPGSSAADRLAAILSTDPADLTERVPATPPVVARIARRCLAKAREARFQSAADLAFALEAFSQSQAASAPAPHAAAPLSGDGRRRSGNLARAGWPVAALMTAAAIVSFVRAPSTLESPTMRVASIASPSGTWFGPFAVSPDGTKLAFTDVGMNRRLWVRTLDRVVPVSEALPGTEGATNPFWSPDGRQIGFFASGQLKTVDLAGGQPSVLGPVTGNNRGGTWNANGVIVFAPDLRGPLYRISSAGGLATPVTALDDDRSESTHRWPSFLPDGRHFVYFVRGSLPEHVGIYLGSIDGPGATFLASTSSNAVFAPPDRLLFVRDGGLIAQSFDPERQTLVGDPTRIVADVGHSLAYNLGAFSVSGTDVLVYGSADHARPTWYSRTGVELGVVDEPDEYTHIALADDDAAFTAERPDARTGANDIHVFDMARGLFTLFTSDPGSDYRAVWLRGSRQIVWASNRSNAYELYRRDAAAAGGDEHLPAIGASKYPNAQTPDLRYLLYEVVGAAAKSTLYALDLTGSTGAFPLIGSAFNEWQARVSPDGRWIAYVTDREGTFDVHVVDARLALVPDRPPGATEVPSKRVSSGGAVQPLWRTDGRVPELYYLSADRQLMAVTMTATGPSVANPLFTTRIPEVGIANYHIAVSRDGERFLVVTPAAERSEKTVVFGWRRLLRP